VTKEQKNYDDESCKCAGNNESTTPVNQNLNQKAQPEIKKIELDPTHFGDWQVNCRAVDF
jgi:hypothetical protein